MENKLFKDLTGKRFSRLLVLERVRNDKYGNAAWRCLCNCGQTVEAVGASLRSGNTKSCGCLKQAIDYDAPLRVCNVCNTEKPLVDFASDGRRKNGRGRTCRWCAGLRNLEYTRIRRILILEHYSGGLPKCACCGETTIEFLSLDHINGGGGQHRKQIGQRIDQWIWKNNLPGGFRVLCHNCNQTLGNYDYCPHQTGRSEYDSLIKIEPPIKYMKLNPSQVIQIRNRVDNGESQSVLAQEFNLSRALVCLIVNRKEWANV